MAYEVNYSGLDRLLHRIAFGSKSLQLTIADIEKHTFADIYKQVTIKSPIFITSLPRAGTTLMLEALHQFPEVATHKYTDMPFIMAPVLWDRLSRTFRKHSATKERAHGDGMRVSLDSPEAFEEILWKFFWPDKYTKNSIKLWDINDFNDEATNFITDHMKKIIYLRCSSNLGDGRYLSKNNGNIARLSLIKRMFPDAKLLIPIREPIAHATSLLRQHLNFIEMHKSEPFVRRYMEDIGHYEFGELHKPIAFPGLETGITKCDPKTIDYWLAYWVSAYEHLLAYRNCAIFFSYEEICSNPHKLLPDLCEKLCIETNGKLENVTKLFHSPRHNNCRDHPIDTKLYAKATSIHSELLSH